MLWNKKEALEEFKVCKKRIDAKEQLLEDIKNEHYLLKKQLFDLYKSQVVYMLLGNNTIKNVETWLNMVKYNIDLDMKMPEIDFKNLSEDNLDFGIKLALPKIKIDKVQSEVEKLVKDSCTNEW